MIHDSVILYKERPQRMKVITILLTVGLLALSCAAQTTEQSKTPADTSATNKKPPVLTDGQRARFWRLNSENTASQAQLQTAQAQAQKAQVGLQGAIEELQKVCSGEGFILALDANGEPTCSAKPDPPKK
jgi:hypothetical protein